MVYKISSSSNEVAVCSAKASVMLYEDATKKWVPSGESGQQGLSKVQIYQHQSINSFRIVGRKIQVGKRNIYFSQKPFRTTRWSSTAPSADR